MNPDDHEPDTGSVVLSASGDAFQRGEDGWWRSGSGRSHGWPYLLQKFGPLTLLHVGANPAVRLRAGLVDG